MNGLNYKLCDTYSVRHVIWRGSIHMTSSPLEAILIDRICLPMLGVVELVLGLTHIGVIKSWPVNWLALSHFILIKIYNNYIYSKQLKV